MTTPPNSNPTHPTNPTDDNYNWTTESRADLPTSFFQFLPPEQDNLERTMTTPPPHHPATPPPHHPATPSPPTISTEEEEDESIDEEVMETNNNPVMEFRSLVHNPSVVTVPHPPVPVMDEGGGSGGVEGKGVFIWTLEEAREMATVQHVGPSSCGLVALDVLSSLSHPTPASSISSYLTINLRAPPTAPLDVYLVSRSRAGTTAVDLIQAVAMATNGEVVGKFYNADKGLSGRRLGEWLEKWIGRGCTPVATLNPQRLAVSGYSGVVPDAWHHQMIHGVSTTPSEKIFIHLTNPLESLPVDVLLLQIQSDSVLLVRREDVLSRIDARTDLRLLARLGQQWNDLNVLGSTAHLLHEYHNNSPKPTPHLAIPAVYAAGITLFTNRKSPAYEKLLSSGCVID